MIYICNNELELLDTPFDMARAEIKHKCVMAAREAARRDSMARQTGRSIYIKRCARGYHIIGVNVTKRQRSCRDMFADAQKLASFELKSWNKKRHWSREAKRHKIMGAHRMAVSYFYKLLKENNIELEEALLNIRLERLGNKGVEGKREEEVREGEEWRAMDRESPFFYKLFGDIEEYYSEVIRLAG